MSWFSRKPKKPREPSWQQQAVNELHEWRAIGESFRYLGRECVVTGYYTVSFDPMCGGRVRPQLGAEYADDLGVIRYVQFDMPEARALMAKQPREAA